MLSQRQQQRRQEQQHPPHGPLFSALRYRALDRRHGEEDISTSTATATLPSSSVGASPWRPSKRRWTTSVTAKLLIVVAGVMLLCWLYLRSKASSEGTTQDKRRSTRTNEQETLLDRKTFSLEDWKAKIQKKAQDGDGIQDGNSPHRTTDYIPGTFLERLQGRLSDVNADSNNNNNNLGRDHESLNHQHEDAPTVSDRTKSRERLQRTQEAVHQFQHRLQQLQWGGEQ